MICNQNQHRPTVTETPDPDGLRRTATAVLRQLIHDRAWCEQRLAERGGLDPIKSLTGSSAMDQAVASAREVILQLDRSAAPSPATFRLPPPTIVLAPAGALRLPASAPR